MAKFVRNLVVCGYSRVPFSEEERQANIAHAAQRTCHVCGNRPTLYHVGSKFYCKKHHANAVTNRVNGAMAFYKRIDSEVDEYKREIKTHAR